MISKTSKIIPLDFVFLKPLISYYKGDMIISNRFVMEFALRLFQEKAKSGQKLEVGINSDWTLNFRSSPIQVQGLC